MSLENLPPLKDVIATHNLRAEKSLGQNFILDQNITDKIVRQAGDLLNSTVIEIGPGPGGLTRSILRAGAKKVIALEFDPRAVAALQDLVDASDNRLEVIKTDALKEHLPDLTGGQSFKIIANLPYNIATPLYISWLKIIYETPEIIETMILMFQKEVGQRITAHVDDKAYGRLSVLAGWLCNNINVYDLPPSAFVPPPKVHSSVIRANPKKERRYNPDFNTLERITAAAFGQRRKMIRSSMKDYADKIEALGIKETLRAENLSIKDFLKIAESVDL